MIAKIIDLQERRAAEQMERVCRLTGLSSAEVERIATRAMRRHERDRAVKNFTRACKQAGLINKLRKE